MKSQIKKEVLEEIRKRNKEGNYDLKDLWDFDKMLEDTVNLTIQLTAKKIFEELEKNFPVLKSKKGRGLTWIDELWVRNLRASYKKLKSKWVKEKC